MKKNKNNCSGFAIGAAVGMKKSEWILKISLGKI
jgi:hypothetical protein